MKTYSKRITATPAGRVVSFHCEDCGVELAHITDAMILAGDPRELGLRTRKTLVEHEKAPCGRRVN